MTKQKLPVKHPTNNNTTKGNITSVVVASADDPQSKLEYLQKELEVNRKKLEAAQTQLLLKKNRCQLISKPILANNKQSMLEERMMIAEEKQPGANVHRQ